MRNRIILILVFLLVVVSVTAIDIEECQVLDEEGETYNLQNDVETRETCFEITADDVTLDCNGHRMIGPGNGVKSCGIHTGFVDKITITNCEISEFHIGIAGSSIEENEIINNNLHGNHWGFI